MNRRVSLGVLLALLSNLARAAEPPRRIFTFREGEEARQLARRECKPLVVHFVPDTKLGSEQLNSFYRGAERIPQSVLDGVIIVAVPSQQYASFAKELGVSGQGGYRTISAYDLSTVDAKSVPTCGSGFM
ncbi:MAG TPA: hypothetical protein VGM03_12945 [Phycisphaerae bacterium]|jgi:hypothetical protein